MVNYTPTETSGEPQNNGSRTRCATAVYPTNEEASAPRTTGQCFVAALTKVVCPQMVQAIDRRLRGTARRGRVRRPIARSPLQTSAQCATISTVGVPETRASERPIGHGICAAPWRSPVRRCQSPSAVAGPTASTSTRSAEPAFRGTPSLVAGWSGMGHPSPPSPHRWASLGRTGRRPASACPGT